MSHIFLAVCSLYTNRELLFHRSYWLLVEFESEKGGSVAEWLACWTQAEKDPGSNRSRDTVG